MATLEEWKRDACNLQREKNEQYEEIKTLKALVKLLVAFIFHRDWISYKQALDIDD